LADIFISYAREDRPDAERLARALQAKGFAVWWDLESLRSGQSFNRAIQQALTEAKCVVVLWSRTSVGSKWVESEAYWAWEHEKLHSVRLDDSVPLPVPFNTFHARSLAAWTGEADSPELRRLRADIEAAVGPRERAPKPAVLLPTEQTALRAEPALTPRTQVEGTQDPLLVAPQEPVFAPPPSEAMRFPQVLSPSEVNGRSEGEVDFRELRQVSADIEAVVEPRRLVPGALAAPLTERSADQDAEQVSSPTTQVDRTQDPLLDPHQGADAASPPSETTLFPKTPSPSAGKQRSEPSDAVPRHLPGGAVQASRWRSISGSAVHIAGFIGVVSGLIAFWRYLGYEPPAPPPTAQQGTQSATTTFAGWGIGPGASEPRAALPSKAQEVTQSPTTAVAGAPSGARSIAPAVPKSFRDCPECPTMLHIPAGSFQMGSAEGEGESDEHPSHQVRIARPFAIGKTEVTFDQWDACVATHVCNWILGDAGWGRGDRPTINVSWKDAQEYVAWLSKKTGKTYRLPTEAEWEYATRAWTNTLWSFGRNEGALGRYAWFSYNAGDKTHPVGEKEPNPWGLHDVHGNAWEWVQDCWNDSYQGAPADGSAWQSGDCGYRVLRGGSWFFPPWTLRSASRFKFLPDGRYSYLGFRVAKDI
jgi:formylglycine-generating enzyme required for sulfatase activity